MEDVNERGSEMIICGIDPGQQGALAFIDTKRKKEWIIDMPLLPERGISARGLYEIFLGHKKDQMFVLIEKAQSMSGQSSVAMFNYGGGYHTILAVLEILEIPFEEIRSNKWKKEFGLSGTKKAKKKTGEKKVKATADEKNAAKKQRKEMAVKTAMQMFPKLKDQFQTAKGRLLDGRAEALLIASYGQRKLGRE